MGTIQEIERCHLISRDERHLGNRKGRQHDRLPRRSRDGCHL